MSNLSILLLFIFILNSYCSCDFGYFSAVQDCDTSATPLTREEFTPIKVLKNSWHYSFLSLKEIEGNLDLEFKSSQPSPSPYILLQSPNHFSVPTSISYTYDLSNQIQQENANSVITFKISINSIKDTNGGWLVIGLYNADSSDADVEMRYFNQEGHPKRGGGSPSKILVAVCCITSGAIIATIVGFYVVHRKGVRQQKDLDKILDEAKIEIEKIETDVQVIIQEQPQSPCSQIQGDSSIRAQTQQSDLLTFQGMQEYFPKEDFKIRENSFLQKKCPVCLEEVCPETFCQELQHKNMVHEQCVQTNFVQQKSHLDCEISISKNLIKEAIEEGGSQEHEEKVETEKSVTEYFSIEISHEKIIEELINAKLVSEQECT